MSPAGGDDAHSAGQSNPQREHGPRFDVRLTPAAVHDLERIPPRYVGAILAFLDGLLAENPARVGKPLRQDLEGLHGARRGDYRVLYEIDEAHVVVLVHRIDHRARVYRQR